jgi:hypothetical protein
MDVYPGRQLALGVIQNHDFNPGVAANGLFWTTAHTSEAGDVDPTAGTATYTATDLPIGDYNHVAVGIANGPHRPAKMSFTITWSPGADPKHVHAHDTTNGFGGDFTQGIATISWSATEDGFTFTSTPGETSKTEIAYVGTEQNGRFFKP